MTSLLSSTVRIDRWCLYSSFSTIIMLTNRILRLRIAAMTKAIESGIRANCIGRNATIYHNKNRRAQMQKNTTASGFNVSLLPMSTRCTKLCALRIFCTTTIFFAFCYLAAKRLYYKELWNTFGFFCNLAVLQRCRGRKKRLHWEENANFATFVRNTTGSIGTVRQRDDVSAKETLIAQRRREKRREKAQDNFFLRG